MEITLKVQTEQLSPAQRNALRGLLDISDGPAQEPSPSSTAPVQQLPTSAPSYTMEQLQKAATPLMDAGRIEEISTLLKSYGVELLSQLPEEKYGDFATKLRQMGARI